MLFKAIIGLTSGFLNMYALTTNNVDFISNTDFDTDD